MHFCQLGDDLVVGGEDERVELDFHYGAEATLCHPDCRTHDPGFSQWSVNDAVLTKVFLQIFCHTENSSELSNIFTDQHNLGVVFHGLAQTGGNAF